MKQDKSDKAKVEKRAKARVRKQKERALKQSRDVQDVAISTYPVDRGGGEALGEGGIERSTQ